MKPIELDVIIPVKDRATVGQCVSNLLAQIELVEGMGLGQILLCDGGSCQSDCQQQIRQVAQSPSVIALACPHLGFNKGWLLNQGLEAATAPIVLISDVDILWNAAVLSSLGTAAASHPERLYYVRSVQESQPTAAAVQRLRYAYRLERLAAGDRVEVYPALPPNGDRPGYGLICGQRTLLHQVGGYRHGFQGWGWEDQDLLIRTQLLGYSVAALGKVTHLSHADTQRNAFSQQMPQQTPQQSRDRNILFCLAGLAQGRLQGDLPSAQSLSNTRMQSAAPISVHYQPQPDHAPNLDYSLPRSPQPPD